MFLYSLALGGTLLLRLTSASVIDTRYHWEGDLTTQEEWENLVETYGNQGLCLTYMGTGGMGTGLEPCLIYCKEEYDQDGAACPGPLPEDAEGMEKMYDPEGNEYVPSLCECDLSEYEEVAEVFLNIVFEALEQLDNIICAVFAEAAMTVIDIGLSAIPAVGPAYRAVRTGVEAAKTIAENGLEAADYGNWVGKACGVEDWSFDIMDAFIPMSEASPDFGSSLGCKHKDKKKCKSLNEKDDDDHKPSTSTKTDDKTTATSTTTTSDETTTATTTTEDSTITSTTTTSTDGTTTSTSTSSDGSCQLTRRASNGKAEGKLGEDEFSTECNGKTVHQTITSIVGYYESKLPMDCDGVLAPQACYHYRSVMSVHSNTKEMTEFTCGTPPAKKGGRAAPDVWGKTAIAKLPAKAQHWGWPWANGWIPDDCERDEFPPYHFWDPKKMDQKIRLIPKDDNGNGGKHWKGFCNDNMAQSTHVIKKGGATRSYIQSDYFKTKASKTLADKKDSKGTTTKVTSVEIETMRPIFSFSAFPGLQDNKIDPLDGLMENKCWPSLIASDDPGWALMTDDDFYARNQQYAPHTAGYRKVPDIQAIKDGLAKANNGGSPPYAAQAVNLALFKLGKGDGQVPDTHTHLYPRVPDRYQQMGLVPRNETGTYPEDPDEGDLGGLSEDEFLEWFNEYVELMFPEELDARDVVFFDGGDVTPPPEPTAAVAHVAREAMPAVQGSVATDDLPRATGVVTA